MTALVFPLWIALVAIVVIVRRLALNHRDRRTVGRRLGRIARKGN